MRPFCIKQGPRYNDTCPYFKKDRGRLEIHRRRPCENRDRNWNDAATGIRTATKNWKKEGLSPRISRGSVVLTTP